MAKGQPELSIKTHVEISRENSRQPSVIGRICGRLGSDYKVKLPNGEVELYGRWKLNRTPTTIRMDHEVRKAEAEKIGIRART